MRKKFSKQGFTLIEFSLSVAFIGILSIAVALIISDTIAAYRRGMVVNQINTTGIDLVDDFRAAVQNSSVSSIKNLCGVAYSNSSVRVACENDGARNFVTVERLADVKVRGQNVSNVPVFGAFCTGAYSYIWNTGYFFSDESQVIGLSPAVLRYKDTNGNAVTYPVDTTKPFRLIKVRDTMRAVCMSATFRAYNNTGGQRYTVEGMDYIVGHNSNYTINNNTNVFDLTKDSTTYTFQELTNDDIVDVLINGSGNNLVLYDLRSTAPAQNASENGLYYAVSFILGTIQGGVNVKASGNYCVAPEDYKNVNYENFDYCAINKFNFAVQATGE